MMRYVNAHEPALTRQEAALLPALLTGAGQTRLRPNIIWPQNEENFVSFEVNDVVYRVPEQLYVQRRGSIAGRAVLTTAGVSLPGVEGMRRGCRRAQDRQVEPPPCPKKMEWDLL